MPGRSETKTEKKRDERSKESKWLLTHFISVVRQHRQRDILPLNERAKRAKPPLPVHSDRDSITEKGFIAKKADPTYFTHAETTPLGFPESPFACSLAFAQAQHRPVYCALSSRHPSSIGINIFHRACDLKMKGKLSVPCPCDVRERMVSNTAWRRVPGRKHEFRRDVIC